MKICYLASAGSLHFKRWYEFFINRGHKVYLISGDTSLVKYKVDIPGLEIFYLPEKKLKNKILSFSLNVAILPFILLKLKMILRKIKPDILHSHQIHPYCFWAALSGFRPFIATPMGSDILVNARKYRLYKRIAKYVFDKASIVTASSLVLKEVALEIGLDIDKFRLIQNGVDLELFKAKKNGTEANIRNDYDISENAPIIFYGRGMVPLYNVDKIVASIPAVLEKYPDCKFMFAHHFGEVDSKLVNMIEKLKLQNSVIFLGFIKQESMPAFMRVSDIFVSVPSSDNSPSSVYEAMACGLPTVINRLPWTGYAMEHLKNTYIIERADPVLISDAIIKLLQDKELCNRIRDGAFQTVRKHFSYRENMKKMEKLMTGTI
ncbi:MAG: glycosyltransferase family 4 protein [Candidatus Omnitrophica bacterium]|nr:glycosyltransferase family 4 protein [Candidatus Omnitrophota bacterium]